MEILAATVLGTAIVGGFLFTVIKWPEESLVIVLLIAIVVIGYVTGSIILSSLDIANFGYNWER